MIYEMLSRLRTTGPRRLRQMSLDFLITICLYRKINPPIEERKKILSETAEYQFVSFIWSLNLSDFSYICGKLGSGPKNLNSQRVRERPGCGGFWRRKWFPLNWLWLSNDFHPPGAQHKTKPTWLGSGSPLLIFSPIVGRCWYVGPPSWIDGVDEERERLLLFCWLIAQIIQSHRA